MRMNMIQSEDRFPVLDQRQSSVVNANSNSGTENQAQNTKTETPELTDQQLEDTLAKLNKTVNIFGLNFEYKMTIHEETHAQMIQIVKDDRVIAEFPPKRLLDALAKIEEELLGLVVDEKV